jgi:hypothetical protein
VKIKKVSASFVPVRQYNRAVAERTIALYCLTGTKLAETFLIFTLLDHAVLLSLSSTLLECPFYRVPEHGNLIALKACARRNISWQLPSSRRISRPLTDILTSHFHCLYATPIYIHTYIYICTDILMSHFHCLYATPIYIHIYVYRPICTYIRSSQWWRPRGMTNTTSQALCLNQAVCKQLQWMSHLARNSEGQLWSQLTDRITDQHCFLLSKSVKLLWGKAAQISTYRSVSTAQWNSAHAAWTRNGQLRRFRAQR